MLKLANAALRTAALLLPFAALIALYRYLFAAFPASTVMTDTVFVVCALLAWLMLRTTAKRQAGRNCRPELAEIFEAFAQRHRLAVNVAEQNATSYTFEAGGRLHDWLVLSVVEGDEVTLDFAGHAFRYLYRPQRRADFERILDDWVDGAARIVAYEGGGEALERATGAGWSEVLKRNVGPLRGKPVEIVANAP